jgi:hypothetical protein
LLAALTVFVLLLRLHGWHLCGRQSPRNCAAVDWRTIYLTTGRLRIETTPPVVPFPLNQPRQSRGLLRERLKGAIKA